jgi:hypothetical protein
MGEIGGDQKIECGDEPIGGVRGNVESELLDGDQSARVRLIGAKDGAENAGTDLVEDTEGTEGVRRRRAGSVRVQREYSSRDRVRS